jgi:hypothetical protein
MMVVVTVMAAALHLFKTLRANTLRCQLRCGVSIEATNLLVVAERILPGSSQVADAAQMRVEWLFSCCSLAVGSWRDAEWCNAKTRSTCRIAVDSPVPLCDRAVAKPGSKPGPR